MYFLKLIKRWISNNNTHHQKTPPYTSNKTFKNKYDNLEYQNYSFIKYPIATPAEPATNACQLGIPASSANTVVEKNVKAPYNQVTVSIVFW